MNDSTTERVVKAFFYELGGELLWECAGRHFGDGESLRTLRDLFGDDLPPRETLRRKLNEIWDIATRHGIRPEHWKKQTKGGPPKPTLHGVEKPSDLHEGKVGQRKNGKNFC